MEQREYIFFREDVRLRLLHGEPLKRWISLAGKSNGYQIENLNYIFCSDTYLLKMNKSYLDHHYLTDVITFDNSTAANIIEADIFISADRIKANAEKFGTSFSDELHRVMIHGLLHLIGYRDKKVSDKEAMRNAEDFWLKKRAFKNSRK